LACGELAKAYKLLGLMLISFKECSKRSSNFISLSTAV